MPKLYTFEVYDAPKSEAGRKIAQKWTSSRVAAVSARTALIRESPTKVFTAPIRKVEISTKLADLVPFLNSLTGGAQ